jgi:IS5 family transposase
VTAANVHDSRVLFDLLDEEDKVIFADSAYVGEDMHAKISKDNENLIISIHEKGKKNAPLTKEQEASNKEKSRIRVRVEHVFGHMENSMNGMRIRTVGMAQAIREVTMMNLAYNMKRYVFLKTPKKKKSQLQPA